MAENKTEQIFSSRRCARDRNPTRGKGFRNPIFLATERPRKRPNLKNRDFLRSDFYIFFHDEEAVLRSKSLIHIFLFYNFFFFLYNINKCFGWSMLVKLSDLGKQWQTGRRWTDPVIGKFHVECRLSDFQYRFCERLCIVLELCRA